MIRNADRVRGFDRVWEAITPKVWSYATNSVSFHDAEDLISQFRTTLYLRMIDGDYDDLLNSTHAHQEGYLVRAFQHRVIDWARKRTREKAAMRQVAIKSITSYAPHRSKILSLDLRQVAREIGIDSRIADGILSGMEGQEIASAIGCSKATVSRRIALLRAEFVKRMEPDERFNTTDIKRLKVKTKTREVVMSKLTVETGSIATNNGSTTGNYNVMDGKEKVATVRAKDGKIQKIELIDEKLAKKDVAAAVRGTLADDMPSKATAEKADGKAKKGRKKATKVKAPTPKAKAKKDTKKKPTKATTKKPADKKPRVRKSTADISMIKIGNGSLKDQIKVAGGEGKCLSGCGKEVKPGRRFLPGYDAKLKSALRQDGSAKAKKLAKALGWHDKINWG